MVNQIDFDDGRVVGMEIDGEISRQDIDRFWALIEERLPRHQCLRIYAGIRNYTGTEFPVWLKNIPKKLQHFTDFEQQALVSDKH